MNEHKDPILPIIISFTICLLVFNIGLIYHSLACGIYDFASEALPQLDLPEPQIQKSIIKMIFIELLSSPAEALQILKSLFNLSDIISQDEPLKHVQLILEIFSLANLYVSWRYGTYVLSTVISVSLMLAYFQVEILLLNYLVKVISSLLDNVFYLFLTFLPISLSKSPPIISHKNKNKE